MAPKCARDRCEPQPIETTPPNWVCQLDAYLFHQWNGRSSSTPATPALPPALMKSSPPQPKVARTQLKFDDPQVPDSNPVSRPHDHCQVDAFPLCRSTGVQYIQDGAPQTPQQQPMQSKGTSVSSAHSGGSSRGANSGTLTVPYGMRYYARLRDAWVSEGVDDDKQSGQRPSSDDSSFDSSYTCSDEDDVSDSFVHYAINSNDNSPFSVPIPLNQMLEILNPIWEEAGLMEAARSKEMYAKPKP